MPPVDHNRVARFYFAKNVLHTADCRNAARARDDRGVAGLTTRLSHDGVNVDVAQGNRLRGEKFIRDHNQRTFYRGVFPFEYF